MTDTPAYTAVITWLEDELRSGAIRVGHKLPPERTLAEKFGMSRASVREGIRILAAMGLVRSATGSGPQAGATVISKPSMALGWALRMHIATRSLPVKDVVDARLLLETSAAREAARSSRSPEERDYILTEARNTLDRMDDPDMDRATFHQLDAKFHILLTSLAGNVVIETIMASLREATVGYVQETVSALETWEEVRTRLQEQHRGILAAAQQGDGSATARLLEEHIRWFYGLIPRELPSGPASHSAHGVRTTVHRTSPGTPSAQG